MRTVRTILVAAFALAALAALAHAPTATAASGDPGLSDGSALVARGPIAIHSDAEWTPANGVRSGTGTPSDPYVISDWRIEGSANHGVHVHNTRASFIVRNVLVDGALGADVTDGFWVKNVTGGRFEHVESRNHPRYGIYLAETDGNLVTHATVAKNGFVGLYAHRSSNLTWSGNLAHENHRHGFYLANGTVFSRITASESWGHREHGLIGFGVYSGIGSDDNVMDNNTVHGNDAGVQVNLVTRNVIRDNRANGNLDRGISITQSTDMLVAGNEILSSGMTGVLLAQSERVTVERNEIRSEGEGTGIEIIVNGSNVVRHNVVRDFAFSIVLHEGAAGNLIYDNLFSSEVNARDLVGSQRWNVSKRAGPNVVGGAFIGGNYWSDSSEEFHDHDEDGLYESHGPYAIGIATGGDFLPLVGGGRAPEARILAPAGDLLTFDPVTLASASVSPASPIVNYTWEFEDGVRVYTRNATRAFARPGEERVVLRVRNDLGLASSATHVVHVGNRAPVAAVAGGLEIASRSPTIRFDASASTDPDGSIVAFEWRFGDGATGTGPFVEHEYPGTGTWAGSLLLVDDVGGATAVGILVVVDATPPTTVARLDGALGNAGWLRGAGVLALEAGDAGGVALSEWRFAPSGAWTAYSGPVALPDGRHEIEYRSVDRAGNVEAARRIAAKVDASPPATALDGPRYVVDATPLALDATDGASGVHRTFYRVGGEATWRVYAGAFNLSGLPEGDVAIRAFSEDIAGNAEPERSFVVTLDRTAPTVALDAPAPHSVTTGETTVGTTRAPRGAPAVAIVALRATFHAGADDATSGVARLAVLVDGVVVGETEEDSLAVRWEAESGRHVVVVEAVDHAGNVARLAREIVAVAT